MLSVLSPRWPEDFVEEAMLVGAGIMSIEDCFRSLLFSRSVDTVVDLVFIVEVIVWPPVRLR